MVVQGNGSQLQKITELIEQVTAVAAMYLANCCWHHADALCILQDKVRLVVDKSFPLEQSRKGFEYIASSAPKRGKTVITFGLKE